MSLGIVLPRMRSGSGVNGQCFLSTHFLIEMKLSGGIKIGDTNAGGVCERIAPCCASLPGSEALHCPLFAVLYWDVLHENA